MLCPGEWLLYDDGIARPIMRAEILDGNGVWRRIKFLVDTGADRTVISANAAAGLDLQCLQPQDRIEGVGGIAESADIATRIRLARDDGQWITLRGRYAACLRQEALDTSVLGRDVLNLFAVIVDRAADRVLLLHGDDRYAIQRRS